jgi:hypothetical protein
VKTDLARSATILRREHIQASATLVGDINICGLVTKTPWFLSIKILVMSFSTIDVLKLVLLFEMFLALFGKQ